MMHSARCICWRLFCRLYFLPLLCALGFSLFTTRVAAEATLSLVNRTPQTIINILVTPRGKADFFIRLDLPPQGKDEIENPDCAANLRVDTGLEFWFFPDVDFARARSMAFCGKHNACLTIIRDGEGKEEHIQGRVESLVPARDSQPVCELGQFRPRMLMRDVCSILPDNTPRDDNGSLLTGLGFGGMLWAARLAPRNAGSQGLEGNAVLEHLELRRPLASQDAIHVLEALFAQGYVPWQAEFPGRDIDFKDSADDNSQWTLLLDMVKAYLKDSGNKPSGKEKEARIMLVPASIRPIISNADAPEEDVQLFTLVLSPASDTLLLDVAAYEGDKK